MLGFPGGSVGKESASNAGDLGSIPELGRSLGEGKGYTLQYSSLENSMDCISTGSQRVGHDWATFTSLHWTELDVRTKNSYNGYKRGNGKSWLWNSYHLKIELCAQKTASLLLSNADHCIYLKVVSSCLHFTFNWFGVAREREWTHR